MYGARLLVWDRPTYRKCPTYRKHRTSRQIVAGSGRSMDAPRGRHLYGARLSVWDRPTYRKHPTSRQIVAVSIQRRPSYTELQVERGQCKFAYEEPTASVI